MQIWWQHDTSRLSTRSTLDEDGLEAGPLYRAIHVQEQGFCRTKRFWQLRIHGEANDKGIALFLIL
jgi:hypothetical protein